MEKEKIKSIKNGINLFTKYFLKSDDYKARLIIIGDGKYRIQI